MYARAQELLRMNKLVKETLDQKSGTASAAETRVVRSTATE